MILNTKKDLNIGEEITCLSFGKGIKKLPQENKESEIRSFGPLSGLRACQGLAEEELNNCFRSHVSYNEDSLNGVV